MEQNNLGGLGTKPTQKRWFVLFLVCLITFVNYLDRANLAVAAPFLSKDLRLNAAMMGVIFSAMGWSYTIMQIPCGWLLDRFGPRLIYGVALVGWSLITTAISISSGFRSMIAFRLGLGFFEAPAFPANNRIVTAWFPSKERGLAIGAYTGAEYIGLALCTPILTWLLIKFGWRSIFITTGLIGVACAFIWFAAYHDPAKFKGVNKAELDLIKKGGGLSDTVVEQKKVTWKEMKYLFNSRQLWGMYIGGFANAAILFFFMTWFPSYLVSEKHMAIIKVGIYGALPYLSAIAGVLIAGKWSDWMISKKYSLGMARKLPVIVGLLLASVIIGANYSNNVNVVITFMCIAFFGQGMASAITWALLSEIVPKELVGSCGGTYNFITNLGGTLSPAIVGYLIATTGSYAAALVFVSSMGLLGAFSYIFIIGKPSRILIPD
ncbi:MFS transporter [Clostridiaceae bacterium UIB06]|uniref:MFS transporter n=1 Tax=Clostridium thailandense TaxID=2794346 RepID=A0A949X3U3_9CLOT|nr:MFS transporter [Clostridium thailandense]MBV7272928.1 MFS transporter [Clostridium thailandense]MCH5136261.1 MFS transporter [Clostridiaceae bacterium UIB06]